MSGHSMEMLLVFAAYWQECSIGGIHSFLVLSCFKAEFFPCWLSEQQF